MKSTDTSAALTCERADRTQARINAKRIFFMIVRKRLCRLRLYRSAIYSSYHSETAFASRVFIGRLFKRLFSDANHANLTIAQRFNARRDEPWIALRGSAATEREPAH